MVDGAIATVRAPTIVLAGTHDPLIPTHCARELAARVPRARLRSLDGAGHELPLAHPDEVATAIRELTT